MNKNFPGYTVRGTGADAVAVPATRGTLTASQALDKASKARRAAALFSFMRFARSRCTMCL